MWLNLLGIQLVLVFIIDLSGALDNLSKFVWKKLYPNVKYSDWRIPLFGCSLCSTWGSGILYLLITSSFSGSRLLYVALLAYMTPVTLTILTLLKDVLIGLLDKTYKLIN